MRRNGDGLVELLVADDAAIARGDLGFHRRECGIDCRHLRVGPALGGESGEFDLQRLAGLDHLGKAVGVFPQRLDGALLDGTADEHGTVSVPHRHHALHLEGDERLTQGRAAHTQLSCEFAFRGEAVARRHLVVGDVRTELLDDHLVQPRTRHRTQLLSHWATHSPFH